MIVYHLNSLCHFDSTSMVNRLRFGIALYFDKKFYRRHIVS